MSDTSVSITVFGASTNFPVDNIIDEFRHFIETNSEFKLNLNINKYPNLPNEDILYWTNVNPSCYYIYPLILSEGTKSKIPSCVHINIVLYYYNKLTPICWLGGTWNRGVYEDTPFVGIPFGEYLVQNDFPPWTYHTAQVMVHEWFHGIDRLFSSLGYDAFPGVDDCSKYGYTIENGWQDCMKYFFSLITPQMYQALANLKVPTFNVSVSEL